MTTARTVLGDRPAGELGHVDYHEHLFQVSPLLVGDELTDETNSGEEARMGRVGFHCHGRRHTEHPARETEAEPSAGIAFD